MPCTMPTRFLVAAIVLVVVSAVRAVPSGGADAPDPARVQRMLKLLAGVASEYREAYERLLELKSQQADLDLRRALLAKLESAAPA